MPHGRENSMGSRLSIGAKLTLRYTVALSITVTVVAAFVYAQVARRINRDAHLLLEVQAQDLAETYREQAEERSPEELLAWMDTHLQRVVRSSDPSLRIGAALASEGGEILLSAGSLRNVEVPLPRSLLDGERNASLRAVNLGGPFAYLSRAVRVPGGFVQMVMNTERYAENVEHIRDVFLLSLPLLILLTASAGWLLARGSLRPISQITQTARRIGGTSLAETVPITGSGDELDQLATTLNDMLGRIADSLERMRRFNANAAHELRTPLTAMSSQLEVTLEKDREAEEYRQVMAGVLERVRSLGASVDAMLRLARSEAGLDPSKLQPTELGPVVEMVREFFEPLAEEGGVALSVAKLPEAVVAGDASWLHQLFSNLVANAIKFTPSGGAVSIGGAVEDQRVRIWIRDTGPGIATEDLDRVFDRYHQLPGERSGFGLGLPIANEISRAHGGRIEVDSAQGAGTIFTVSLPLASAEDLPI